ncbi:MAG: hypothetical protein J6B16_02880 [Clostridia bacterium]|nr:hypothetical protein [Clostridia bacterium]
MKFLKVLLSLIITISAISVINLFAFKTTPAQADESTKVETEIFSPNDYFEYYALKSPKYVYEDDKYVVFIEDDTSVKQTITVYDKTIMAYKVFDDINFTSIGKVIVYTSKKTDTPIDYLIFQNYLRIYSLNIATGEVKSVVEAKDNSEEDLSSFTFDYNGEFFAVSTTEDIILYTVSSDDKGRIELKATSFNKSFTSTEDVYVALNGKNLFYNLGQSLYSIDLNDVKAGLNPDGVEVAMTSSAFSFLIADETKLYYIANKNISYFDINNFDNGANIAIKNTYFSKLGDVASPYSISFYNGNLLVVDNASNTIQEFSSDTFEFTGKAVSTVQYADNRVNANSSGISLYNKTLAVLSPTKVQIIDTVTKKFTDINFTAINPTMITLGKDKVVIANQNNIEYINYKNFDANKPDWTHVTVKENIYGVDYQNDAFHFISADNGNYSLLSFSENDFTLKTTIISVNEPGFIAEGSKLAVDLDGNAYIYNNPNTAIKKFELKDGTYLKTKEYTVSTSLGIDTDLFGNLYSLSTGNTITKIDVETDEVSSFTLSVSENLTKYASVNSNANAFALNFDDSTVYFTFAGHSFVLKTDGLQNYAVDNIVAPTISELIPTDENADNQVKKVVVTGKNLFNVDFPLENAKTINYFTYNERYPATDKEYVVAKELDKFYILLATDEVVLIKKTDISADSFESVTSLEEKAIYVSTNVNLYYFPIMSFENAYCVKLNNTPVRFEVGCKLTALGELTINGVTYYYVETTYNDTALSGYVPVAFLSEHLSENEVLSDMKYVFVKNGTTVYADDLTTEVYTFSDVTEVRSFETKNGYVKIAFNVNGEEFIGYVKVDNIIIEKDNTVRNALLIIVASILLAFTCIYLIHKKKTYVTAD